MDYLQNSKMQFACFLILLYMTHHLFNEKKLRKENCLFYIMHHIAILSVAFDGITAYTVNHIFTVGECFNRAMHLCFFLSLNATVFFLFLYLLKVTIGLSECKKWKIVIPSIIEFICMSSVLLNYRSLDYNYGKYTDYSMGMAVYISFVANVIFFLGCFILLLIYSRHLEQRSRLGVISALGFAVIMTGIQCFVPQILCTSLSVTVVMVACVLHLENPALKNLEEYHQGMIMGFSTLVENRDDSTGGHIRRTSAYVDLILDEMKKKKIHKKELTKDFIKSMILAAPMHDIGKIAIPDAVLQKPGKLTDEEFSTMKKHTILGGQIIQDTFWHLNQNKKYAEMVYNVAVFHHEKWNGRGYPEGISGMHIPLCARIMAVADVFDAVSAKRCYRDAMPLDKCFEIIEQGSGSDFDPEVVEVFLAARPKVEEIYNKLK